MGKNVFDRGIERSFLLLFEFRLPLQVSVVVPRSGDRVGVVMGDAAHRMLVHSEAAVAPI